jgi:hypothetical protein
MDWVMGDVTPLDVYLTRQDGEDRTSDIPPKLVSFYDVATNRTFGRVFLMPKGRMIGRAEVLETVAAMLADPAWSVPRRLHLDNGPEFQWDQVARDICRLRNAPELFCEGETKAATAPPSIASSAACRPPSPVSSGPWSATAREPVAPAQRS